MCVLVFLKNNSHKHTPLVMCRKLIKLGKSIFHLEVWRYLSIYIFDFFQGISKIFLEGKIILAWELWFACITTSKVRVLIPQSLHYKYFSFIENRKNIYGSMIQLLHDRKIVKWTFWCLKCFWQVISMSKLLVKIKFRH